MRRGSRTTRRRDRYSGEHEGGEFLDIQGSQIVKNGSPIRLRGTNLGNWMILEHYMMGLPSVEYHMRSTMRATLVLTTRPQMAILL